MGPGRRESPGNHLDARASRLSLSRRRHQQSDRANQIGRRRSGLDRPGVLLGRVLCGRVLWGNATMNPLKKAVDSWFGRGEASITIPPMDGAFRPNDLLDL